MLYCLNPLGSWLWKRGWLPSGPSPHSNTLMSSVMLIRGWAAHPQLWQELKRTTEKHKYKKQGGFENCSMAKHFLPPGDTTVYPTNITVPKLPKQSERRWQGRKTGRSAGTFKGGGGIPADCLNFCSLFREELVSNNLMVSLFVLFLGSPLEGPMPGPPNQEL